MLTMPSHYSAITKQDEYNTAPATAWRSDADAATERQHAGSPHATSSSIPLPGTMSRTQSEVQLSIDQAAFDQKSLIMFHRLVNGIRDRQNERHHGGQYYHQDPNAAAVRTQGIDQSRVVPDYNTTKPTGVSPPCDDEWSISGFQDQNESVVDYRNSSWQRNPMTLHRGFCDEVPSEDEEEQVFEMDL